MNMNASRSFHMYAIKPLQACNQHTYHIRHLRRRCVNTRIYRVGRRFLESRQGAKDVVIWSRIDTSSNMICTHSCHATGFLEMKSTCDTNPNIRRRNQTNRIVTANVNLSVHSLRLSSTQHMYRMRELYCCCFNRRVD